MTTGVSGSRALLADVRASKEHASVEAFYTALFAPGTAQPYAARDLRWSSVQAAWLATCAHFPGPLADGPASDIYRIDAATGALALVRRGARLARPSPGDRTIAMVEDAGLILLGDDAAETRHAIEGRIEQMEWSPDGSRLALLVAGAGADLSGAEGGFALNAHDKDAECGWLPQVDTGDGDDLWRTIWVLRPGYGGPRQVTRAPLNVWEFSWCGDDALAAVASDHHGEGSWYSATLRDIDLNSGASSLLYEPRDQIALPRATRDGRSIAFIETVCSDRGIVCGALHVLRDGEVRTLDTRQVDVSDHHWNSDGQLVFAGLRGLETVIGVVDPAGDKAGDLWASETLTCGEWHPSIALDGEGDPFAVFEAYARAPFVGAVRGSNVVPVLELAVAGADNAIAGSIEAVRWTAPDGLEIEGWLIRNRDAHAPAPLLVDIHGGPIWAHRNRWAARLRAAGPLVAKGWSVLLPNPRGAPGRGREFAARVVGDMGGADARDLLAGIEHLVSTGIADSGRIAVTGASYGGFMSAMLVTLTGRLAAAVPISPVTNWYSQHYTSQIPSFDEACLQGSPRAPGGQYFERSPTFHATGATTPTLIMAGALDRNTPPTQALEFHRALLEAGCPSALCTYPRDGHSLRGYPAYLDSAVRTMIWLEDHCTGEDRS